MTCGFESHLGHDCLLHEWMESVDTADSKSVLRKGVGVQVPPHALLSSVVNRVHILQTIANDESSRCVRLTIMLRGCTGFERDP